MGMPHAQIQRATRTTHAADNENMAVALSRLPYVKGQTPEYDEMVLE
jgi:hypothetical protein